jgi:hypothetical protein
MASFGEYDIKAQVQTLFALKAPSTVIGLFWKDAICCAMMFLLLGSGDVPIITDSTYYEYPDRFQNDLESTVYRFSNASSFVCLLLILAPLLRVAESTVGLNESRILIIAGFHLTPVWSFKGMVQDVLTNLDKYVGSSVLEESLYALAILVICSAFAMAAPAFQGGLPYCLAVIALGAASMNAGVAYSFNNVSKAAAGDQWDYLQFQVVYTAIVTVSGLVVGVMFHHRFQSTTNECERKVMKFIKIVPGFVAAWAWQALAQVLVKQHWTPPSDPWEKVAWQGIYSGCIGIVGLVILSFQCGISRCISGDTEMFHEYFTTITSCNVGWAWRTFGTDVYNALDQQLCTLWLITAVATILLPMFASLLLWLIKNVSPFSSLSASTSATRTEEGAAGSKEQPMEMASLMTRGINSSSAAAKQSTTRNIYRPLSTTG